MASFVTFRLIVSSTAEDKTTQHSHFFVPRAIFASEKTGTLK